MEEAKTDKVGPQKRRVMWRGSSAHSGSRTVSREDGRGANFWIMYPITGNDEAGRAVVHRELEAWVNGGERGPALTVLYRYAPSGVILQNGHRVEAGWGDEIDRGLLIDALVNDVRPAT